MQLKPRAGPGGKTWGPCAHGAIGCSSRFGIERAAMVLSDVLDRCLWKMSLDRSTNIINRLRGLNLSGCKCHDGAPLHPRIHHVFTYCQSASSICILLCSASGYVSFSRSAVCAFTNEGAKWRITLCCFLTGSMTLSPSPTSV